MIDTFRSRLFLLSKSSRLPPPASEQGLTLIEVLMAALVLAMGVLGTFGLLNTSAKTSAETHDREGATSLARQVLEDARTIPFAQLSPSSVAEKLQEMKGLEPKSGETPGSTTWHIARGGSETQHAATYTVSVSECAVDDPKDGLAKEISSSEAAEYCEEHKGAEEWKAGDAIDSTPIDFKRVTVHVSWQAYGRSSEIQQATMIGAAGESTALSASELQLVPPPEVYGSSSVTNPVITTNAAELTFSVCAPKGSTAVQWSLEGVAQSPAPELGKAECRKGEGEVWTFKWKIGEWKTGCLSEGTCISDGTYQVSAQAITTKGVLGAPVTIPVTLIRGVPAAPKGIKGGFNEVYESGLLTKVVELEWQANSERNVIGYRVHGPSGLVCPSSESTLSTSLTCIELETKYEPADAPTYTLAALYRDAAGNPQEGEKAIFTVGSSETPGLPQKLTCEGSGPAFTWQAPTEGAAVAFYRIYRDSIDYPGYDTASSIATRYEDANAAGTHRYWVTAVSQTLTESSFAGPVEC